MSWRRPLALKAAQQCVDLLLMRSTLRSAVTGEKVAKAPDCDANRNTVQHPSNSP